MGQQAISVCIFRQRIPAQIGALPRQIQALRLILPVKLFDVLVLIPVVQHKAAQPPELCRFIFVAWQRVALCHHLANA